MQRAARLMNIKNSINRIVRLAAALILLMAAVPDSANCATRSDMNAVVAHSCCAPSVPSCDTAVVSRGCCCKAAPVDRAASPGLIASTTTPFFAVTVLPQTPLPSRFYAQSVVARDSVVATASPPKLYIFYRALLI